MKVRGVRFHLAMTVIFCAFAFVDVKCMKLSFSAGSDLSTICFGLAAAGFWVAMLYNAFLAGFCAVSNKRG